MAQEVDLRFPLCALRAPLFALLAALPLLGLTQCSKRSNTLEVSPPLPPAEEPADDVKGAYGPDAGALRAGQREQKTGGEH